MPALVASQDNYSSPLCSVDLLIHLGDISGAYLPINSNSTWRINPDGRICDTFRNLKYVFEMEEINFFKYYVEDTTLKNKENKFLQEWNNEYKEIYDNIPELPFSNPWIAKQTISKLPENSILHLGILNTLRSWNYFETPKTVLGYANTGGFGIDGNTSSLIGASLGDPNKLYFGVVGDLSFFYDMNSIGNHHVGKNLRLMVINNGKGAEFRIYNHPADKFGEKADDYMAAARHYGNKSPQLIKHYAEDLGFRYLCANNKEEYLKNIKVFIADSITDKPILFEVFTDAKDESDSHKIIRNIKVSKKGEIKKIIKNMLGEKRIKTMKKIIKNI